MDLVRYVEEQGGVAARKELIAFANRAEVDGAVADGRLMVLSRGRLAVPGTLADDKVAALRARGVVSGLSAARRWGWSLKHEPTTTVVTVPRNRSRALAGVTLRRQDLPPDGIVGGIITSRAQTVVDCARTLPFDEALCVADSALRDGLVTGLDKSALERAAGASPRTGRSRALRVVDLADHRAANAFESVTRAIVLDVPGLRPQPQGDLGFSESGLRQYGDLVDPRLRVLIECESWAFHAGEEPFRRDIRRYTRLTADGWTVLRFVYEDVMQRPAYVRDTVARTVARLERRSSPPER